MKFPFIISACLALSVPLSGAIAQTNQNSDLQDKHLVPQTLEFSYESLYKSLDAVTEADYAELRLAFYLKQQGQQDACLVESGVINDGVADAPVVISPQGEMLLPLNERLKKDKAKVQLKLLPGQRCALSMQIEVADKDIESMTVSDLQRWSSQMSGLFNKLAGWPGRYFMPDVQGLTLEFSPGTTSALQLQSGGQLKEYRVEKGLVFLTVTELEQLDPNGRFTLPGPLVRIAPRLER